MSARMVCDVCGSLTELIPEAVGWREVRELIISVNGMVGNSTSIENICPNCYAYTKSRQV